MTDASPVIPAVAEERPTSGKSAAIARELASQVVSGALLPGTLLPTEFELVERHGASRPVIREASRLLGGAGLVETRHGVGSIVNPPRRWDVFDPIVLKAHLDNRNLPAIVDELLELRRVVEVESAATAARRRSDEHLATLGVWLDRMGAGLDDVEPFASADFAYHEAIIEAAGNRFFAGVFRYVRDALWEGRLLTSQEGGLSGRRRAFEFHRTILEAVASRDAERARSVMTEHMRVAACDLRRAVLSTRLPRETYS